MRRSLFATLVILTACASSARAPPIAEDETRIPAPPHDGPTTSPRIRRPIAIRFDPPVLTPEAIAAGVVGPAHVSCALLEDGLLYNCALLKPVPTMDRAIKLALNGWSFKCATESRKPVPVEVRLEVPLAARGDDDSGVASTDAVPRRTDRFTDDSPPANGFREEDIGWQVVTRHGVGSLDEANVRASNDPNVLVFRCKLTMQGALSGCRAVKPHPMAEAVLPVIATWKYKPVQWQGKPVDVDLIVKVRISPKDGGAPAAADISPLDGGE